MNINLLPGDDSDYAKLIAALEVGEQAIRGGQVIDYSSELLDKIERDAREQNPE